jgi:hypothetical protein
MYGTAIACIIVCELLRTLVTASSNTDSKESNIISNSNNNNNNVHHINAHVHEYKGPNPWKVPPISLYQRLKIIIFFASGIAIFRLLMFVCFFIIGYLLALLSSSLPIVKSNQTAQHFLGLLMRFFFRVVLFLCFSFYYIQTEHLATPIHNNNNSKCKNKFENARIIISNHHTLFDALFLLYFTNGSIAAKKEISGNKFVGQIMNLLKTLWIDRHASNSRSHAKQQIINRAKDYSLPPLLIFPQGPVFSYIIFDFPPKSKVQRKNTYIFNFLFWKTHV